MLNYDANIVSAKLAIIDSIWASAVNVSKDHHFIYRPIRRIKSLSSRYQAVLSTNLSNSMVYNILLLSKTCARLTEKRVDTHAHIYLTHRFVWCDWLTRVCYCVEHTRLSVLYSIIYTSLLLLSIFFSWCKRGRQRSTRNLRESGTSTKQRSDARIRPMFGHFYSATSRIVSYWCDVSDYHFLNQYIMLRLFQI